MGIQYNTIENVPVASFETSWKNESANQPIKSVVAEITPTQDLHGYDYPWPPGGGKNLLPCGEAFNITRDGIVFTSNGNGTYTVKGTADNTAAYKFPIAETVLPNEVYVHLGNNAINVNFTLSFFHNNTNIVYMASVTSINRIRRVTSLDNQTVNALQLYVAKDATIDLTISPMIMTVSTATPYTPYSNTCPITGKTGATVWRTGKNIFDYTGYSSKSGLTVTAYEGGFRVNGVLITNYSQIVPQSDITDLLEDGVTYTLSQENIQKYVYPQIIATKVDGSRYYITAGYNNFSFTVDKSTYVRYVINVQTNTMSEWGSTSRDIVVKPQFEKGSTATPFSPYSGASYPVSWQTEAGTVYGGTVDVVSGELVVDRAMMYVDGSQNIYNVAYHGSSDLYYTVITNTLTSQEGDPSLISNRFRNAYNIGIGNCYITNLGTTLVAVLPDQTITTREQAKQWFVDNPTQFVYALATPQTYQLSGAQIKTLLGVNNVWADSGNIKKLMWQYTIFDLLRVFINGFEITDFIAFGGWQRERGDVDGPESGRTLDARMHRARVATKMRYNVTCRPLLVEELSSLERLIMPEYVTVKVIGDPFYGTWEKTCYVNNTSSQYLIRKRNGAQWWGGITFPIIEV